MKKQNKGTKNNEPNTLHLQNKERGWDSEKKAKSLPLAPLSVEILFVFPLKTKRISTESGTIFPKTAKSFCSKK